MVRVVDGDTVDVRLDGEVERVRLLNIDTPETKHPQRGMECLGPEATAFLEDRLTPGEEIELEFDVDQRDRYGRVLAGVFADGSLVNAEIARAGFGAAVYYAPNRRFLHEVQQAEDEARAEGVGLFSDEIECTIPAAIAAFEQQVAAVPTAPPEEEGALEEVLAAVAVVAAAAVVLDESFDGLEAHPTSAVGRAFRDDLDDHRQRLDQTMSEMSELEERTTGQIEQIREAERVEREREEAEREAARVEAERAEAEREELERQEAERAAAAQAEAERAEQERQEAANREADRGRDAPAVPQPDPADAPAPPRPPANPPPPPAPNNQAPPSPAPPGPETGPPGHFHKDAPTTYTGPRCFAPGGKWWKPCG